MAISFVTVFTMYCSDRVGWFLLVMLIGAPILSILYAFITAGNIRISAYINGNTYSKGEKAKLRIAVSNKMFIPALPVTVYLKYSPNMDCDGTNVIVAAMPGKSEKIDIDYSAKLCGGTFIGVSGARVMDFFGIVSLEVKDKKFDVGELKVGVFPEIPKIHSNDEGFRQVLQSAYGSSDSEDTLDERSNVFGGYPGYEYREYVPGDPLKRINSKLSLKREKLYIRLDEKQIKSTISVILDPCMTSLDGSEIKNYGSLTGALLKAVIAQNAIEKALGVTEALISNEFAVEFWIFREKWEVHKIFSEENIYEIRNILAYYIFSEDDIHVVRTPTEIHENYRVVFSPVCDDILIKCLKESGAGALIYAANSGEWRSL